MGNGNKPPMEDPEDEFPETNQEIRPQTAAATDKTSTTNNTNDDGTKPSKTETEDRGRSSTHILRSSVRGKSDIETLAQRINERRSNRIEVTFKERKQFLGICFEVAKKEGGSFSRLSLDGLKRLVDEFKERVAKKESMTTSTFYNLYNHLLNLFGVWDMDKSMLKLFEAGLDYTIKNDEDEFYFRDFNFYYLTLKSRFTFLRVPQLAVFFWLLCYYFGSAVLFCAIMQDENVCPKSRLPYSGWLTSVYFASVTMSTVGYGDVSLIGGENWQTLIGIIYMLISIMVGYTVFSAAAEMTFGGMFGWDMFSWLGNNFDTSVDQPLYKQIRRLVWLRAVELTAYFLVLNAVGVFVAKIFVYFTSDPAEQWNWMTTIYWAVQTTTTIGYGDLTMPFQLRWFNIFFTTFGTAFVGSVFGSIASMRSEINDRYRYYAWRRREVSKMMINEMQTNDDNLDQYEFVVASLLMLNKIEQSDLAQIMDKFRELAGDKGYVYVSDETDEEALNTGQEADTGAATVAELMDMDIAPTRF